MSYPSGSMGGKVAASNDVDWSITRKDSYNDGNTNQNLKDSDPKSVTVMNTAIPYMDPMDIGLGSSEKGNTILTTKNRKKSMTSVYLKYFETALDGKIRRCKICGQIYSIATATGNLGRHLNNRHPGYDKIGDFDNSSIPQIVTVTKKPHTQVKLPPLELDHLNWLLLKWLILASLPTSILEDRWMINAFKFLHKSAELWPGEKFRTVIFEIFRALHASGLMRTGPFRKFSSI